MRPYMLWLTRVYGGQIPGYATAFLHWPNVIEDWLKMQTEARWQYVYDSRDARHSRMRAQILGRRTSMSIGSRLRVASQREVLRLSRAAGQGGR